MAVLGLFPTLLVVVSCALPLQQAVANVCIDAPRNLGRSAAWQHCYHDSSGASYSPPDFASRQPRPSLLCLPTPLWAEESVRVGPRFAASSNSEAVIGSTGTVYVVSQGSWLEALRLTDGKVMWRVPVPIPVPTTEDSKKGPNPVDRPFSSNPSLEDKLNMLFVYSSSLQGLLSSYLITIDTVCGRTLWSTSFEGEQLFGFPLIHSGNYPRGPGRNITTLPIVLVMSKDSENCTLTAVGITGDAVNKVLWRVQPTVAHRQAEAVPGQPIVGLDGSIYFHISFAEIGVVYLFSVAPEDGQVEWKRIYNATVPPSTRLMVRADGAIMLLNHVIDNRNGDVLHTSAVPYVRALAAPLLTLYTPLASSPLLSSKEAEAATTIQTVGSNSTQEYGPGPAWVYGVYEEASVVAKMTPDLTAVWQVHAPGIVSAVTVDGGSACVVYVSSAVPQGHRAFLTAYTCNDGSRLWEFQLAVKEAIVGPVNAYIGGAVIAGDGTLLVNAGNVLYRLGACSGHGNCSNDDTTRYGACTCAPSWYGAQCSTQCWNEDCAAANPKGHVMCGPEGGCVCKPDWYPAQGSGELACTLYCNTTACKHRLGSHAKCNLMSGQCECDYSWFGPMCGLKCDKGMVSNNTCSCKPNYYGRDQDTYCSIFCHAEETCSGFGSCSEDGRCACKETGFWSLWRYPEPRCVSTINIAPCLAIGGAFCVIILAACVWKAYKRNPSHPNLGTKDLHGPNSPLLRRLSSVNRTRSNSQNIPPGSPSRSSMAGSGSFTPGSSILSTSSRTRHMSSRALNGYQSLNNDPDQMPEAVPGRSVTTTTIRINVESDRQANAQADGGRMDERRYHSPEAAEEQQAMVDAARKRREADSRRYVSEPADGRSTRSTSANPSLAPFQNNAAQANTQDALRRKASQQQANNQQPNIEARTAPFASPLARSAAKPPLKVLTRNSQAPHAHAHGHGHPTQQIHIVRRPQPVTDLRVGSLYPEDLSPSMDGQFQSLSASMSQYDNEEAEFSRAGRALSPVGSEYSGSDGEYSQEEHSGEEYSEGEGESVPTRTLSQPQQFTPSPPQDHERKHSRSRRTPRERVAQIPAPHPRGFSSIPPEEAAFLTRPSTASLLTARLAASPPVLTYVPQSRPHDTSSNSVL